MRKDFHLHPTVLQNPNIFDSFIRQAVLKNIGEICVTDHMPLSISDAGDRIRSGRIPDYCRCVREFKEKYSDIINIKCGIEIDFHPDFMGEIEEVLGNGDFDYILASSHMHVFVRDFNKYTFNDFAEMAVENSIKAAQTGYFNAISHLDMYRFVFEDSVRFPLKNDDYSPLKHEVLIKELLHLLARKGMYLEINPHLAESKQDIFYTYPEEPIVKWALERNVKFSYGSDAHVPESVGACIDELEKHPIYGKALEIWESQK